MIRHFAKASVLAVLCFAAFAIQTFAAPATQSGSCLWITETANGQGGYSVCDDNSAKFRTAYERFGLQQIGYPISQRYVKDGFVTQAFQKGIMQWRPDTNSVALVNIFDDLHSNGSDRDLLEERQTPLPLPANWDGRASTAVIIERRQGLLSARAALRTAYFASPDPLTFFGLPTSEVEDMGNHYAIRLQRAVLQEWKETVPWAQAGQVTIANGGMIAQEFGLIPAAALRTERTAPTTAAAPATTVAKPSRLRIPAIGVNASLEHVSLDANGAVAVPQNFMNGAWWQQGTTPGNVGNSIIVGHFDSTTGPAVFFDLGKLKLGDKVITVDANGKETTFEVVEMQAYRYNDFSIMDKVYGQTPYRNLNLITCNGIWDPVAQNYDKRLVVFTRIVE